MILCMLQWAKVPSAKFSILEHQMNPTSNFSSYRSTLKAAMWRSTGNNVQQQCLVIPFFSLLIKDIYFLNEGCANRYILTWSLFSYPRFMVVLLVLNIWCFLGCRMVTIILKNFGSWLIKFPNLSSGNVRFVRSPKICT